MLGYLLIRLQDYQIHVSLLFVLSTTIDCSLSANSQWRGDNGSSSLKLIFTKLRFFNNFFASSTVEHWPNTQGINSNGETFSFSFFNFYNLHSLKSLIQPFLILFFIYCIIIKRIISNPSKQFQLLQNDDLNFQLLEMKNL